MIIRCPWAGSDPVYIDYHDHEWGKPIYDERLLFEFLILEGMQAGLSWITVLKKRERFRQVFDNFDPERIANYSPVKINSLLNDRGIIRNRLKINAVITNAQALLMMKEQGVNFSEYLWGFVNNKPIINKWACFKEVPVTTSTSDAMSNCLKTKKFKFVGSTICYAFMQATGMVNDHLLSCFCSTFSITS